MRIIDRQRGGRRARLARYIELERAVGPGPLSALRRAPRPAGAARLKQFLRIARGRKA